MGKYVTKRPPPLVIVQQEVLQFQIPDGIAKNDQFFGDIEAYYNGVTATIALDSPVSDGSSLVIQ